MEIDINYALVYYTTNVNIMGMYWKTFGTAFWYDARLENYHQAHKRANDIVWEEIYDQFPHLKGIEFKYTESGDMTPDIPIIPKSSKYIDDAFKVFNETPNQYNKQPTLEEQIRSVTELKVLESYKFIVKGKPELEKAYDLKRYELNANNVDKAYPIKLNELSK